MSLLVEFRRVNSAPYVPLLFCRQETYSYDSSLSDRSRGEPPSRVRQTKRKVRPDCRMYFDIVDFMKCFGEVSHTSSSVQEKNVHWYRFATLAAIAVENDR